MPTRYVPLLVAVVNTLVVAAIVRGNQPHYSVFLMCAQALIVFSSALIILMSRLLNAVGLACVWAGMMLTFSAMLLYIPTFAAVIWTLTRVRYVVEAEANEEP
jgi:hypothetical protein